MHTHTLTLTHIYVCVCMSGSVNNMFLTVHPENLIRNTADYILSLEMKVVSMLFYNKPPVLVLREKRNSDRLLRVPVS